MAMLPVDLPESFIVTGEGLPRACFGEQQHDIGMPNELPLPRRYVEQFPEHKTSTACGSLAHAVAECIGGTLGNRGRRRTLHWHS